jgi:iron-sulfur cluster assembly accessory protein
MLTVTPKASEKIHDLMRETPGEAEALRVRVVSGGCSGLSYGLNFEKDTAPDDQVFETNGVRIIVDPRSALYLEGVEIDYVEGLQGSGFKIANPNAKSSCGCGESFKV